MWFFVPPTPLRFYTLLKPGSDELSLHRRYFGILLQKKQTVSSMEVEGKFPIRGKRAKHILIGYLKSQSLNLFWPMSDF